MDATKELLAMIASALVIFLALMWIGRRLKKGLQLDIGASYQILAASVALLVPLSFVEGALEFKRALHGSAILSGTFFFLAVLKRALWKGQFQEKRGAGISKFASDLMSITLVTIAMAVVASWVYGIRIPGLLAGSGVVAIILGLSMQETLGNIISGLSLQFEKAFKTGDWLIVGDRHAEVMEINWRSTRLRATDNVYFDLPNSQLARQTVVNLSYPQRVHAMRISVRVENDAPPNRVRTMLLHAAAGATGVLAEPEPKVFLNSFGESCIEYEIKFWLEDQAIYHEIRDAILTNIWYELDRAGIRLAFARRTIQVDPRTHRDGATLADTIGRAVREQPLFQCLGDQQTQDLLAASRSLRFGRGEKIIEQGSSGASMFLLLEGEANVLVRRDGHADRVATLRAGDCFGEMSLLTGEDRSATVAANKDCAVVEIGKEAMGRLLQRNPSLVQKLSELLAQRHLENVRVVAGGAENSSHANETEESKKTFLAKLRSFFSL